MKRAIFPILLMLLPLMASAETLEIDGIWYNLFALSKEADVTRDPNMNQYSGCYSGSIEIPPSVIYNNVEYSVTSIGSSAFSNCRGLSSITIPSSVTSIGSSAFGGCSGLRSITIPSSVTSIGENAFADCSSLTSIVIPNSVTSIGNWTFSFCSGLTSVTISNNARSIGKEAFRDCSRLKSIIIPNSVTSIGGDAFWKCNRMTSVTIGSGVTKINNQAFSNCYVLKDVYCLAEKLRNEEWSGEGLYTHPYAFADSDPEYATLHVPAASIEAYRTTEPWCQFGNIVALTDGDPSPTGVNSLKVDNNISPETTFSLDGRRLSNPQRGLNIIRMNDGSTKKVMIK